MKPLASAFLMAALTGPVSAEVVVQFEESAPKDRFLIRNEAACALADVVLTLDLGASAAGLIFDVTGSGAGVSVYQPLEFVAGREFLGAVPEVRDGDSSLSLPITSLPPGAEIAFTIDVDDTRGTRATMIAGNEIAGAKVSLRAGSATTEAHFAEGAVARVFQSGCNT